MKDIEQAVNNFKQKNGGEITYTTKELLAAVWVKLDKIYENNIYMDKKITRNQAIISILTLLVVGILFKVFVI